MLALLLTLAPSSTAFVDVNVIPMDREIVLSHQTVITQGMRVLNLGPTGSTRVPVGARIVNGRGKFLMPGLIDMHVHLYAPPELGMYLANGVTTVYNLNGKLAHLVWRDRIAKGTMLGPTIVSCGPTFYQCETAEDGKARVEVMSKQGYDAVKIYNDVTKDAFPAIVDTARAHHMLVVGHIPRAPGFEGVIEKRMPVAHAEEFMYTVFTGKGVGKDSIPPVVKRTVEAGIPVTATLVCFDHIYRQATDLKGLLARPEVGYLAPWQAELWQPGVNTYEQRFTKPEVQRALENSLNFQKEFIRQLHKAGGKVLVGTDANCPGSVPGFGVPEEIRNFGAIGFSPYEALRAATVDSAEVLNRAKELGSIETGMQADLVLLDANPLQDLGNLEKRSGVMCRGKWLPATKLRSLLAGVQPEYAKEAATGMRLLRDDPSGALSYFAENDPFGGLGSSLLAKLFVSDGIAGYRRFYAGLKKSDPRSDFISEDSVNEFGYFWLKTKKDPARAVEVLELNAEEHPKSANAWDSLGEAYLAKGDKEKAIESYRKAVEIDPKLESSVEALKKLGG